MTDGADEMSVKNCAAVNGRLFNVRDYHQAVLFVRIDQIQDTDILLRDVGLSHVTSSRASFQTHGFDFFRGTLSRIIYPGVSADDVTTLTTSGMTVVGKFLNNGEKVFLIERTSSSK